MGYLTNKNTKTILTCMIILHSAHCVEKKVLLEWKINHFYLHKHNYFYHTHLPDITTLPPLLQKICPQATLLCVRGSGTDACGGLCRNHVKEVQQVMDCIHVGNTQLTANDIGNDIGTLLNWQTVVHTDQLLMHYYRPCCVVISALAVNLHPSISITAPATVVSHSPSEVSSVNY